MSQKADLSRGQMCEDEDVDRDGRKSDRTQRNGSEGKCKSGETLRSRERGGGSNGRREGREGRRNEGSTRGRKWQKRRRGKGVETEVEARRDR
eukprot:3813575-Pleurochrysis_carterae.AAC.1